MATNSSKLDAALAQFPARGDVVSYGTAGFRTKASILASPLLRVGLLAALRSQALKGGELGWMEGLKGR